MKNSDEFKWLLFFEYNKDNGIFRHYKSRQQFPFGIHRDEFMKLSKKFIKHRVLKFDDWLSYTTYMREMVMISWSMFFNEMLEKLKTQNENSNNSENNENENKQSFEEYVFEEYYKFMDKLISSIPRRYEKAGEYAGKIMIREIKDLKPRKVVKKIVTVFCVNILGMVVTSSFGPIAGAVYQLASGFVIDMGFDIAKILMNGGKVDWKSFVSILKKRSKELVEDAIITVATFSIANALSDYVCSTIDQITHSIGLSEVFKNETIHVVSNKVKEFYVEESVDSFMELFVEPAVAVGFWIVRDVRKLINEMYYKHKEKLKQQEFEFMRRFGKKTNPFQIEVKRNFIKETLMNQLRYSATENAVVPLRHKFQMSLVLKQFSEATKYGNQTQLTEFAFAQEKYQIQRMKFELLLYKEHYGMNLTTRDASNYSLDDKTINFSIKDKQKEIMELTTNFCRDKILKIGYKALDNFFKRRLFKLISNEEFKQTMRKLFWPFPVENEDEKEIQNIINELNALMMDLFIDLENQKILF